MHSGIIVLGILSLMRKGTLDFYMGLLNFASKLVTGAEIRPLALHCVPCSAQTHHILPLNPMLPNSAISGMIFGPTLLVISLVICSSAFPDTEHIKTQEKTQSKNDNKNKRQPH